MLTLIELKDAPKYLLPLKTLLTHYGNYMFDELNLVAGKETFYKDLIDFPGDKYDHPEGTYILACINDELAGCTGIKKFDRSSCEMKRMFVDPEFRGKGIGRSLCLEVIRIANLMNYKRILLDSNEEMNHAVQLYLSCGFKKIPAYCVNENDNPVYMEYMLGS